MDKNVLIQYCDMKEEIKDLRRRITETEKQIWKIEEAIHPLIKLCVKLLSPNPLFFLINSYTTGLAPAVLTYMLATDMKKYKGHVDSQEIGLPVKSNGLVLPCGASGRWEAV